ncbi:hypothetical protein PENTCL1PPCAC_9188, partial [Pristionchus entomophagus]
QMVGGVSAPKVTFEEEYVVFCTFAWGLFIHFIAFGISASCWPDSIIYGDEDESSAMGVACTLSTVMTVIAFIFYLTTAWMAPFPENTKLILYALPGTVRKLAVRIITALLLCLFTSANFLSVVYYGMVKTGIKTPISIIWNLWILSIFPMSYLMNRVLRVGSEYSSSVESSLASDADGDEKEIKTIDSTSSFAYSRLV